MPQIVQLTASLSIWVYPNDHAPPHFHLIGPDTNAVIDLRSLEVVRGRYRRGDLRRALAWAAEHADDLDRAWRDQHDEG